MLTPEQAQKVADLAELFEQRQPVSSFADFLIAQGEADLLTALEAALREAGDQATLDAIYEEPDTPENRWKKSVREFDAPTDGGPWAIDKNGDWFEVTKQAPGGKVGTYQGRSIYIPPQHPSTKSIADERTFFGAKNADEQIRWTEQKFRMARSALLGPNPWYDLYMRVAPRGGAAFPGRWLQDQGIQDNTEGGELYPDLEPGGPQAMELDAWYRQNFGNRFSDGYPGLTLDWLRVYTDPDGWRAYRPWSHEEMKQGSQWMRATTGRICPWDELNEYVADAWVGQSERWAVAAGEKKEYGLTVVWPSGPLTTCTRPTSAKRKEALKKAAIVAAIVAIAIFAPAIAAKVKTFAAKVLPKLKGAAGTLVDRVTNQDAEDVASAEREAAAILNDPETQAAIARGELPPPPTSTADPAWGDYANVIAQWYLQRELANQRAAMPAGTNQQYVQSMDEAWLRANQADLQRELERAKLELERVAGGGVDPDAAAENFAKGGELPGWAIAAITTGAVALLTRS